MTAYRDDSDALRARVDELEKQLASTQKELDQTRAPKTPVWRLRLALFQDSNVFAFSLFFALFLFWTFLCFWSPK